MTGIERFFENTDVMSSKQVDEFFIETIGMKFTNTMFANAWKHLIKNHNQHMIKYIVQFSKTKISDHNDHTFGYYLFEYQMMSSVSNIFNMFFIECIKHRHSETALFLRKSQIHIKYELALEIYIKRVLMSQSTIECWDFLLFWNISINDDIIPEDILVELETYRVFFYLWNHVNVGYIALEELKSNILLTKLAIKHMDRPEVVKLLIDYLYVDINTLVFHFRFKVDTSRNKKHNDLVKYIYSRLDNHNLQTHLYLNENTSFYLGYFLDENDKYKYYESPDDFINIMRMTMENLPNLIGDRNDNGFCNKSGTFSGLAFNTLCHITNITNENKIQLIELFHKFGFNNHEDDTIVDFLKTN